jgi:hypothetical protein
MTDRAMRAREMLDKALAAEPDHMVATGADLDWLMLQLACWPKRVDQECTTNMRFLMTSAAATLRALALSEREGGRPSRDDVAGVLFNQRKTSHDFDAALEADPESDAGTLLSICRDDADVVLQLFSVTPGDPS